MTDMGTKKRILFIDKFAGIQEIVQDQITDGACNKYDVKIVAGIDKALEMLAIEKYDGIVMDGLESTLENRLSFIKKVRIMFPQQSIIALLSAADFGLNSEEKQKLMENKVSVSNKVYALSYDNIETLFGASCKRGYGEEICFQEGTQS